MATCNPEYTGDTLVRTQFCHCQVSSYNMFLETGRLAFSRPDQHCGLITLLDKSCQDNGAALLMQVQDHWWSNPDSKHVGSTPRHACSNPELHLPCTQCPLCRIVISVVPLLVPNVKPSVHLFTPLQMRTHYCIHMGDCLNSAFTLGGRFLLLRQQSPNAALITD